MLGLFLSFVCSVAATNCTSGLFALASSSPSWPPSNCNGSLNLVCGIFDYYSLKVTWNVYIANVTEDSCLLQVHSDRAPENPEVLVLSWLDCKQANYVVYRIHLGTGTITDRVFLPVGDLSAPCFGEVGYSDLLGMYLKDASTAYILVQDRSTWSCHYVEYSFESSKFSCTSGPLAMYTYSFFVLGADGDITYSIDADTSIRDKGQVLVTHNNTAPVEKVSFFVNVSGPVAVEQFFSPTASKMVNGKWYHAVSKTESTNASIILAIMDTTVYPFVMTEITELFRNVSPQPEVLSLGVDTNRRMVYIAVDTKTMVGSLLIAFSYVTSEITTFSLTITNVGCSIYELLGDSVIL